MTSMSETVRQAIAGDQQAWRDLIRQYEGLLRSIARRFRLNSADADDAAQATWTLLVQHLTRIRDPERIAGWLACTMRRQCIALTHHRRREIPIAEPAVDLKSAHHEASDARLLISETAALVHSALARLPPRQRQLLVALSPEPAPSYVELSLTLSMAVGTIGPTRAKALRRMHGLLTESFQDEDPGIAS